MSSGAIAMRSPSRSYGLLTEITCPNCWQRFPPEKILWVAEHDGLYGDSKLGANEKQRFIPSRFTVAGEAIDGREMPCHRLACPSCHLLVPRPMLELPPVFLSIFGAPGSGKSYVLAAMTWELRRVLPLQFLASFADADPELNLRLNQYERALFANEKPDEPMKLAQMVKKTEQVGADYNEVDLNGQRISYTKPFLFAIQPQAGHPQQERSEQLARTLCLYDNAGESFSPGEDQAATPHTRHMALSQALFFVFDPMQEPRFRRECTSTANESARPTALRQESVFMEAAARIRRFAGLKHSQKHDKPLVVIVAKADRWDHLLGDAADEDPYVLVKNPAGKSGLRALQLTAVEERSALVRALLLRTCPEIVTAAEGFSQSVTYVPVSAVGRKVMERGINGEPTIRPGETAPYWVTVPFVYSLSRILPGLIPRVEKRR